MTYMREHHNTITGHMHVRLDAMHTRFHRSAKSGHAVFGVHRFVAPVGDYLRQRATVGLFRSKGPRR